MGYGGIEFKHIWKFQIKIMMGNQYSKCVNATSQKDIIVACLRLGWNDAFRHTSKNIDGLKENQKESIIVDICEKTSENFKKYAEKDTTEEKYNYINNCLADENFKKNFNRIKVVAQGEDKALCLGHIQKMFNMALKLFLCLKICAEQADCMGIDIGLNSKLFECKFAFDTADCPIDSIILDKLNYNSEIKWSKLGQDEEHPAEEYKNIQDAISKKPEVAGKSNLFFDFENWN